MGIRDDGSRRCGGGGETIRIRTGSWEIDAAAGTLLREGREVPIQAKPLALLRALVERRDRIASKAELTEAVWPDVAVSDAAFTSALRDLRRTLGDDGEAPRFIETLRGRGEDAESSHARRRGG